MESEVRFYNSDKVEMRRIEMRKFKGKKITSIILVTLMLLSLTSPIALKANDVQENDEKQARSVDVNKPVIEQVILPETGTVVKVGDFISIEVKAYDSDSGINEVFLNADYKKNNTSYSQTIELSKNDGTDYYTGQIPVQDASFEAIEITKIRVVDKMGNYMDAKVRDDNYKCIYSYIIDPASLFDTLKVESVEFSENQQKLSPNENYNITVTIDGEYAKEIEDLTFNLEVPVEDKYVQQHQFFMSKNPLKPNEYTLTLAMTDDYLSGKYQLASITGTLSNGLKGVIPFDNADTIWFTFEGKGTPQHEQVQIKSLNMSVENGVILQSGDKVKLEIELENNDNHEAIISDAAFVSSADIHKNYIYMNFKYDKATNLYVGEYEVTKDTYPCEWSLDRISISDANAFYNGYETYKKEHPQDIYFNVKSDDTFVVPTYKVNAYFNAIDAQGNYVTINTWENNQVERRTTLKDAGLQIPDGATDYQNLSFQGWVDGEGKSIDIDEEVTSDQTIWCYAKYDKLPVSFTLKYLDENMNLISNNYKIVIPQGSTFNDLLTIAKSYYPNQYYQGEEVDGWVVSDEFYNSGNKHLDDKILPSTINDLSINLNYKDKKVMIYYLNYYAENMNKQKTIVDFVGANTTYEQLSSELANIKLPEETDGLTFKNWKTEYYPAGKVRSYDTLNLIAEYDKIPVNVDMMYVNNELQVESAHLNLKLEKGSSYKDLLTEVNKYTPDNYYQNIETDGWDFGDDFYMNGNIDDEIKEDTYGNTNVYLNYKEKQVLCTELSYVTSKGNYQTDYKVEFVDKNTTYEKVKEEISKTVPSDTMNEMKFENWTFKDGLKGNIKSYSRIIANANYDNIVLKINFQYVDSSLHVQVKGKNKIVSSETTYRQLFEQLKSEYPTD